MSKKALRANNLNFFLVFVSLFSQNEIKQYIPGKPFIIHPSSQLDLSLFLKCYNYPFVLVGEGILSALAVPF